MSLLLRAQAEDSRVLSSLMPPGSLFYVQAKDFGSLLSSWNNSSEKRHWLTSSNFQVLALSRLMQRLSQAQDEFDKVGAVPIGMNLTSQVAGTRSVFAFYDLAALSFVYLTQMPRDRVESTPLWRIRTRYQSREVAGIPFYVKTDADTKRTLAFTSYKGWFVVATSETRMAETLVLLSGAKAASLSNEPWFVEAEHESQAEGDLRLVYNLKSLLATPQFRTYWIQRNKSELKPFAAGISDLFATKEGFAEYRALIRVPQRALIPADSSWQDVLAFAPSGASLYRAWNMPTSAQLSETLAQVVTAERVGTDNFNALAPQVTPDAGSAGSEADLDIRIDEPPFQRLSGPSLTPLVDSILSMQPVGLLHVQTATVLRDQVFVLPESAVVVICKQPDRASLNNAIAQLPPLQTGALDPLRISIDGNAVVIGRLDLARTGNKPPLAPGVTYAAVYNHQAEWPHYKKLFALIDTHAINPQMTVSNSTPTFFSGNLQSLGDTFSHLRSASITSADNGSVLRETVRYELP
jgi:hypothetical protein